MNRGTKADAPILSCIVAASENFVIGRGGDLPWHLPRDLKRFRRLTMGHHIVMGRRTWESIGRPLPGRTSIVLSRREGSGIEGALVVRSLDAALEAAADDSEVFVIGGENVFAEALPRSNRLYLTLVHAEVDGDVYFPGGSLDGWQLVEDERFAADGKHAYDCSFRVYVRKGGAPPR